MTESHAHPRPKDAALSAIGQLKDSASYEEMIYELSVLQKIERGLEDLKNGRTASHEQARERLGKWLG